MRSICRRRDVVVVIDDDGSFAEIVLKSVEVLCDEVLQVVGRHL